MTENQFWIFKHRRCLPFLAVLLVFLIDSKPPPAFADTVVELSIFEAQRVKVWTFNNEDVQSDQKVTIRFAKDRIDIKSGLVNLSFDFAGRQIVWVDGSQPEGIERGLVTFDEVKDRGASVSEYLVTADPLPSENGFKEINDRLSLREISVKKMARKWRQTKMDVWIAGQIPEVDLILGAIRKLEVECGVLPKILNSSLWFESIRELNAVPILLHKKGKTRMPVGRDGVREVSNEIYVIVRSIGDFNVLSNEEVKELVRQKTRGERWSDFGAASMDKIRGSAPIVATLSLLLLIFLPLWVPKVRYLFSEDADRRYQDEEKAVRTLIRFRNMLAALKLDSSSANFRRKWTEDGSFFEEFRDSRLCKKNFRSEEKKMLSLLYGMLREEKHQEKPEKHVGMDFDPLMKKCGELIEKHVNA